MALLEKIGQKRAAQIDEREGKFCGATTLKGNPCMQPRGWKTNHSGEGRCKTHEGYSNGSPVPVFHVPAIEDRMERYLHDRQVFSLDKEIALARAYLELFNHHLAIFNSLTEQEIREGVVPIDIGELTAQINSITRNIANLVKTKHEIEVGRKYVIDIRQVHVMFGVIGKVIDEAVEDPEMRLKINAGLNRLVLPMAQE